MGDQVGPGDGVLLGAELNADWRSGTTVNGANGATGNLDFSDLVKVNAFVYLCSGVTLERGVMISAGVTFTNDRFPRATTPDLAGRSFGTNVLEAALLALLGKRWSDVVPADYEHVLEELRLKPRVVELG